MKDLARGQFFNITNARSHLVGQLLAAHPLMDEDIYNHSVILVTNVTEGYISGIQLDRIIPDMELSDVCRRLDIEYSESAGIYRGGNRGFQRVNIVHTSDWSGITTEAITDQISVTRDISVLVALSAGLGPSQFRACAGHWVWRVADSWERSRADLWMPVPADPDLVFAETDQWRLCRERYVNLSVHTWID